MATQPLQVYKCEVCGIIAEVLDGGGGALICCGKPMTLLKEKTAAEEGKEKHVPVLEANEGGLRVKVGSVPHPMEPQHYIEWIEVITADGRAYRQFLKPGQAPEAAFCCLGPGGLLVREYCNKHGLWKA